MKKKTLVIAIVVILIACLAAGTFAYYTVKGIATNVITFGTVKLDLTEKEASEGVLMGYLNNKDIVPDMKVSKVPIVKNTGTEPFYTRMLVEIAATAADGKTPLPVDCVKLHNDTGEWVLNEDWFLEQSDWTVVEVVDDGDDNVYTAWFYYNDTVEPDQKVAPFNIVEFTGAMNNDYVGATITVTLRAQAVQSEHNPMTDNDATTVQGWPALPVEDQQ